MPAIDAHNDVEPRLQRDLGVLVTEDLEACSTATEAGIVDWFSVESGNEAVEGGEHVYVKRKTAGSKVGGSHCVTKSKVDS